jgi:isoleucyl-tRNA synthetase
MFEPVAGSVSFPQLEAKVGQFWKDRSIYEKSLQRRTGCPQFIFFEGPPTANGMPHPGHCLTRAIKDVFPRYRTMRGYYCERKGGWDTHGLPVEVEVCKELGIHSKEEIEEFGVEPFIHKCQESVWRYMQEWERLTERLGFWIHLDEAYVTYHKSYVESVWWSLKKLFDRGLLYQGHKIVWWWAQGGTALSSGEVGDGYREVADPSVYVRFPLVDEPDTSLLVWTTTPWTLPSNQFVAVHPELEYSVLSTENDGRLIVASALVETVAEKSKQEFTVESTCKGIDLLGKSYCPPFDEFYSARQDESVVRYRPGEGRGDGLSGRTKQELDLVARAETAMSEVEVTGAGYGFGSTAELVLDEVRREWRVVTANFVSTESGTGAVHIAPAFGEIDYDILVDERVACFDPKLPLINCVGPDGKFTDEAPEFVRGRWVKDCDKELSRDLKQRGLLYHQEQYLHDYPFCPRAENDALIQYPRKSWFVRTTEFKDRMLANNREINWLPEHIKDGRFGNFLETNVDWALSRERYWGTPLPIWVCDQTGKSESVASYDELLAKPGVTGMQAWDAAKAKNPDLPDDLKVHKPYIDEVTYDSQHAEGGRMRRVPEVIDCWFDAGSMPFAQWGYPQTGNDQFTGQFPADFISEAIDQTRGWFYALLAISTLLFSEENDQQSAISDQPESDKSQIRNPKSEIGFPHPFRNCIVLGLMLAESNVCVKCGHRHQEEVKQCTECGGKVTRKTEKMSKRLRNYREPNEIFDRYGADALRWYFFANQTPWTSIIYSERAIKESIPEFLLRLWNVYSFFVIYANIDEFDPGAGFGGELEQLTSSELAAAKTYRPVSERAELDRWVISELNRTAAIVCERMDAYDNYGACQQIIAFVDGLSNWYVRRSRGRFWSGDQQAADKIDAYWTLYECLVTTSKLIAPFVPFLAEAIWQNLAGVFQGGALESVHLCDFPTGESALVNEKLSQQMDLVREISSLGRAARMDAKLKVRQPLAKVEVVLADRAHQAWLEEHEALIRDELNVKQVHYTTEAEQYITYQVQPDFKRLGPRVGKLMPAVKQALQAADGGALLADLEAQGKVALEVSGESIELTGDDIQVRLQAKEGWAAAQGRACVVVLSTELTPELIREGYARDVSRLVNDQRKELGCEFTDRIVVGIVTDDEDLRAAINENREFIMTETLAVEISFQAIADVDDVEMEMGDLKFCLYVKVA